MWAGMGWALIYGGTGISTSINLIEFGALFEIGTLLYVFICALA